MEIDKIKQIEERALRIALERNGAKTNQTVCRGRTPLEKHFMGAVGELLVELMLGATMDFNAYGGKGDGSNVDGVLPDGRGVVCKSIGPQLDSVWIPKVCLLRAGLNSVVVAVRIGVAPKIENKPGHLSGDCSSSCNGLEMGELLYKSYGLEQLRGSNVRFRILEASLLGWMSVGEFLKVGRVSYKHLNLKESLPGKPLERDICLVVPIRRLRKFRGSSYL